MIRITGSAVGIILFDYNFPIVTLCFTIWLILTYIHVKKLRKHYDM
jgi:hypothetical protein